MPLSIVDIEVLGEDGRYVLAKLNDGSTAVLEVDNIKVQEYIDERNSDNHSD